MPTPPLAFVLHAPGTNRDHAAARALEMAGARAEIVHIHALDTGERRLHEAQLLLLPGGFSYGDDLGAGRLWAHAMQNTLGDHLNTFVESELISPWGIGGPVGPMALGCIWVINKVRKLWPLIIGSPPSSPR